MQTFARHKHIYDFYSKTGEMVNFHHDIQQELLVAYRAKVDPYYTFSNTCPVCVCDFLNQIYRWYDNRK